MKYGVQILWPPFVHLLVGPVEFYTGWRPGSPIDPDVGDSRVGFGNEGDIPWLIPFTHWLKRHRLGNLGMALRIKKAEGWPVSFQERPWIFRRGF